MTLTQLRYFVAIADAQFNITLAAERVHATQPGLSKQLKLLEDALGFLLFARKGRNLVGTTQAGEFVLEHARQMLTLATNIKSYAANERSVAQGKLTIVTTPLQARYILPASIANLKIKHPSVSVHLQASAEHAVLDKLVSEKADLAILSTSGAPPETGFAIPLYRWKRVAVVEKTHALAQLPKLSLQALADYPLISYESSNRPQSSLMQAFQSRGLQPEIGMTAPESDLIKTYAKAGVGVGIVAEMSCYADLDSALKVLELPPEIPHCTCWAVIPNDRVTRSYILDLLVDIAPQLDRVDLQRAINGLEAYKAPRTPTWLELSQAFAL